MQITDAINWLYSFWNFFKTFSEVRLAPYTTLSKVDGLTEEVRLMRSESSCCDE